MVKIKYTQIDKKSYETSGMGLDFSVSINGKPATGYWMPKGQYVSNGVDVNELTIPGGRRIQIFKDGGTYRSYEIAGRLEFPERQPKNLRFTGRTMTAGNLKNIFVSKIIEAINGQCKAHLSDEFLSYFGLKIAQG